MRRTAFLIDGFNVYHSLKDASREMGGAGTRWLDLRALCESFLYEVGGGARLVGIDYFSARPRHLEATKPDVTLRQLAYVTCLSASGVSVHLGQFKPKRIRCPHCAAWTTRHEEKETDVAIATRMLELAVGACCEAVVVMSGDSDLAPAMRAVRRLQPVMGIVSCFPFNRHSKELAALADRTFKLRKERYVAHQFADPFETPDGRRIAQPAGW